MRETIETQHSIQGFFGKYRSLSNYDTSPFKINGIIFKSGEHAFHYYKTLNSEWRNKILNATTPSDAKKLGRQCPMRNEWDKQVVIEIIPELRPIIGFNQNNPYHFYDVLSHILLSVNNAPRNIHLRLTMLLHDIAKSKCYSEVDGVGHFYGHQKMGSDMARKILTRLKYDNETIDTVTELILYHDADIQPRKKCIKRWLNKIGKKRLYQLIEVKKADVMAQSFTYCAERLCNLDTVEVLLRNVIKQQECFSLKNLAVNGRDLMNVGVPEGKEVGLVLNKLLDMVISEEIENNKEELLRFVLQEGL